MKKQIKSKVIKNYAEAVDFFKGSKRTVSSYSESAKFIYLDGKMVTFPFLARED